MTGKELRAIRSFNGISQAKLAERSGYECRDTIRRYEKADFVPHKFVVALSELISYDFTSEKKLAEYLSRIPSFVYDKYKFRRTNSIYPMKF